MGQEESEPIIVMMENHWSIHNRDKDRGNYLPQVLIIGAGISGLVCGRILKDTGFRVKLLEARDRIGGRIWTERSMGFPCELGASWIHGKLGNPLYKWCLNQSFEVMSIPYGGIWFYEDGIPSSHYSIIWQYKKTILGCLSIYLRYRVKQFINNSNIRYDVSVEELASFLYKNLKPQERRFLKWIVELVEAINGAPAGELSIKEVGISEIFKSNLVIKDGYDVLINDVSNGLDIETGVTVKAIEHSRKRVLVHTSKGRYTSDICVITVPLGVLKAGDIDFIPPLQSEKIMAINRIGYGGVLNKVVFTFKNRFWEKGHERITRLPEITDENNEFFGYWADFSRQSGVPCLVAFAGGAGALKMDKELSDKEIKDIAFNSLKRIFGEKVPVPDSWKITRWFSDPFSRGSYSYGSPGSSGAHRRILSEPCQNRLFFAGEATEPDNYGTVHGALLSGVREARRIHGIFCCKDEDYGRIPWR